MNKIWSKNVQNPLTPQWLGNQQKQQNLNHGTHPAWFGWILGRPNGRVGGQRSYLSLQHLHVDRPWMLLMLRKIPVDKSHGNLPPKQTSMIFQQGKWKMGTWVFGENGRHPKNSQSCFASQRVWCLTSLPWCNPMMNPLGVTHEDSATNALQKSVAAMKPVANFWVQFVRKSHTNNQQIWESNSQLHPKTWICSKIWHITLISGSHIIPSKKKHRFSLKVRLHKIFTHLTSISPPAEMKNYCTCRWIRNSYPRPKAPWEPRNLVGSSSIRGYPGLQ